MPETIKLLARDFFRRESQAVTVEPRTPQGEFPLHEHEFNELVIVVSGNGWHVLDDQPHLLTRGEFFYIRAEDHHLFEQVHDLFLTNVLYRSNDRLLRPELVGAWLDARPGAPPGAEQRYWQLSDEALEGLRPLLESLARESAGADPISESMAEALFVQLGVALRRNRFVTEAGDVPGSDRLVQVLGYLRHSCTGPIDLDEVAHRFGYSQRTFTRAFRDATATTPHHFLVKLRIGHAMRALRRGDRSITEIALASGFNDGNYFSYAFNRVTGLSPSEYRRRHRGGA